MQPAGAFADEQPVPIDLAGMQLRGGRVAPVGAADRAADAKAPLGEVETVADAAPDPVVGDEAQVRRVNAALEDQVFDEPAHGVVGERRHYRRAQAEAPAEAAGHVVLATALPDAERPCRRDTAIAGIQPQHDLAEGD